MVFLNNERVARDITKTAGFAQCGTAENLGPANYDCRGTLEAKPTNAQQRFQGLAARSAFPAGAADLPGPGAYADGGVVAHTGPPGSAGPHLSRSAFEARGPRIEFMASVLENPGPGTYDISRNIRDRPVTQALREPTPLANRVPMEPDDGGPGPAAYQGEGADAPRGGRGADFSTSASEQRLAFAKGGLESPGPATYDVCKGFAKGPSAPFRSTTGRGRSYETDSPGPAMYPGSTGRRYLKAAASSPSFKSESQRGFGAGRGAAPGPGQYDHDAGAAPARRARSASTTGGQKYFGIHSPQQVALLRATDGIRLCGFSSSCSRLPQSREEDKASPGQYDCEVRSLAANVRRKGVGRPSPFGSHVPRMASPRDEKLDPCTYQTVQVGPPSTRRAAAAFGTSTARSSKQSDADLEACPGTYDWRDIGKVDYRSKLRRPRAGSGFGSRKERFVPPPESLEPGPGAYEPPAGRRAGAGILKSTQSRIAPERPAVSGDVGPGEYHQDLSWVKKSFNVSHASHAQQSLALARAVAASR